MILDQTCCRSPRARASELSWRSAGTPSHLCRGSAAVAPRALCWHGLSQCLRGVALRSVVVVASERDGLVQDAGQLMLPPERRPSSRVPRSVEVAGVAGVVAAMGTAPGSNRLSLSR